MDFSCIEMFWSSGIIVYESKKIRGRTKKTHIFFTIFFMWQMYFLSTDEARGGLLNFLKSSSIVRLHSNLQWILVIGSSFSLLGL